MDEENYALIISQIQSDRAASAVPAAYQSDEDRAINEHKRYSIDIPANQAKTDPLR